MKISFSILCITYIYLYALYSLAVRFLSFFPYFLVQQPHFLPLKFFHNSSAIILFFTSIYPDFSSFSFSLGIFPVFIFFTPSPPMTSSKYRTSLQYSIHVSRRSLTDAVTEGVGGVEVEEELVGDGSVRGNPRSETWFPHDKLSYNL